MKGLADDVRFALRVLRRTPAFTLAAVLTLALGIAASTAIFSAANAALLKPLPYPHAEDIRTVRTEFTDGNQTTGLVAPVEFFRLQDPKLPLERFAMARADELTLLLADNTPVTIVTANVSEGFFELFGLPYALGGFTKAHFEMKQVRPEVIISHRLWREVLGSDPKVIGKTLRLAEFGPGPPTIAGVASPDMNVPRNADVWFNVRLNPQGTDFAHVFDGYLRVRRGTTEAQLQKTMTEVAKGLERDYPGPQTNRIFIVESYVNAIVGDLRPILIIVLSATGLLLLLACVNVTNLLLARGTVRGREMATRSALGATRNRLARQMLTESAVLAAIGAVAGVAVAYAAVKGFLAYGASEHLPRLETVPFDWQVLAFASAVLVAVTVLVGLVPAMQLSATNVQALISQGGRSVRGGRVTHRTLNTMIVAEISVALVLVAGAGWLVRSFTEVQAVDPGWQHRGRLVFELSLPGDRYRDPNVRTSWVRTLTENLQGLKGVTAVGLSSSFPLQPEADGTQLTQIKGFVGPPFISRVRIVSPGFFDAMGIRMRSGRKFTQEDRLDGAPVVIVNQAFAKKYLNGIDVATTDLAFGFPVVRQETRRPIIGIVDDVKYASLIGDFEAAYYLVWEQNARLRMSVAVATTLDDPTSLIPEVRAEVKKLDPLLAVNVQPVDSLVEAAVARQKLGMTLMLLFGAVALALAAIGIYGVIAYASAERRAEVATRLALGAAPSNIFWLLLRHGRVMTAAGIVLGLVGAYAAGNLASTWLYAVQAWDPAILGTALVAVLVVTLAAMLIPAWRASQVDPGYALRGD
jgi:predicted permease